jgi:hypothetical protein
MNAPQKLNSPSNSRIRCVRCDIKIPDSRIQKSRPGAPIASARYSSDNFVMLSNEINSSDSLSRTPTPELNRSKSPPQQIEVSTVLSSLENDPSCSVCEDCVNTLLEDIKGQIASANNDLSKYTEALFELERDQRQGRNHVEEGEANWTLIKEKEDQLTNELASLVEEEARLGEELRLLEDEEAEIDGLEEKVRNEIFNLNKTILNNFEIFESISNKLNYLNKFNKKLKNFNLITESFHINTSSPIVSINGIRLSRNRDILVPWNEINSGWGFAVLLVDILMKKFAVSVTNYRLIPRGNASVIIRKSDKTILELFSDENSSNSVTRFITGRKFDSAISAFFEIVGEIFHQSEINFTNFDNFVLFDENFNSNLKIIFNNLAILSSKP